MAFFRFSRDKRGYEHFYLVEPVTNRKGKSRTRVLYWYRTPPNIKVGRPPFDDDTRRAIEAQYPNVTFEWDKIVDAPIPSADAEKWRDRRRAERAERTARRSNAAGDGSEEGESPDETEHAELVGEEPIEPESPSAIPADAESAGDPVDSAGVVPGTCLPPTADAAAGAPAAADTGARDAPTQETGGGRTPRKRRRRRRGHGQSSPNNSATPSGPAAAGSPAATAESAVDDDGSDEPIDEPSGE